MANEVQDKVAQTSPEVEVAASDNVPAQVKKVELDLDDAPFLQAEEKNEEPEQYPENLDVSDEELARKKKRKKMMIFGAAGLVILIAAAVAVWWFFFRGAPPVPPEAPKPEVVVVPSTPGPAAQDDIVREFAPFIVPTKDASGQTRFLVCKFSAISTNPVVNQEIQQQLLPLRDAIYYYLRSKDSAFLLDARNGGEIKQDLLSVFNDYLTQGKLEDIVFESYLSR